MDENIMKVASISDKAVESINSLQSKLKTEDGKDVILIAYEKR